MVQMNGNQLCGAGVSGELRFGVSFHTSFIEILDSHYFGYAWILFWCTGIVVKSFVCAQIFVSSAALQKHFLDCKISVPSTALQKQFLDCTFSCS